MSAALEELLPAEQRARRGRWSPWRAAPPVTASDIRRWAMAVYWPEQPPAPFVDEDAAGRRWPPLEAPQELNPFAWLPGAGGSGTPVVPGVRRVLGGCRLEFGVPIRVGDVVRRRVRLDGWTPKSGRSGGLLLVDHTHEWRNQDDELVRTARYTLIYQGGIDAPG